ncbi:MAG TPA: hypothetical protein PKE45_15195 [Caldilineaceae bacterium]|nr:hypothetical protein [Caldilineaceae bacterium]
MTTVSAPRIDVRSATPTIRIRTQTPFKGMFKVVGQLRRDL